MKRELIPVSIINLAHILIYVAVCSLCFSLATVTLIAQDLEVYGTNQFGFKNITPSIVIEENSATGNYDVYAIDHLGLRQITPDAIIESDEYRGSWKVYRVSDYGLRDLIPALEAETNPLSGNVCIYDVNKLGFRDVLPSTIIERESFGGDIKLFNINEYGIRDISPFEVIKKQGDHYEAYSVGRFGLPEITPTRVIEVKEQPAVFGIVLLPSIKQIKFQPGHVKLRAIERAKVGSDSLLRKEGWLKSKPKAKAEKE